MSDFYARRIIEALRSGISSRELGLCFSSARPKILRDLHDTLERLAEDHRSGGRIISGKYGEGKTHLLNTVMGMARQQNIVVSTVTLSKETPLSGLHLLYPKILQGVYLPNQVQPGITSALEQLSPGSPVASSLLEYCLTGLETNRLFYVLKSYLGTQNDEEKYALLGDMEGDFIANSTVRQIYRRVYNQNIAFNVNFAKTQHAMDYFAFLSRLFLELGYNGWALLFDEAELTGRLSKKGRLSAYANMAALLKPNRMEGTFCLFVFNASYIPDVIEAKHEHSNLEEALLSPEIKEDIRTVLSGIASATQLLPLNKEEILDVLAKIQLYHGQAYNWEPNFDPEKVLAVTERHGYLLRTRIRTAIEMLDHLYQYGETDEIQINELGQATFEDEESSLESFV
jgi:hypothetical protein